MCLRSHGVERCARALRHSSSASLCLRRGISELAGIGELNRGACASVWKYLVTYLHTSSSFLLLLLKALTRAHLPRTLHTPLAMFVRLKYTRRRTREGARCPEPTMNFRLSHTMHRQRSRKRPAQKSLELRPCGRAEREAAALGAPLLPPQLHLLLLEVSPVLLVDEHQVEEVFDRELVVDVLERGCQVIEPACVQAQTSLGARARAPRRG